MNEIIVIFVFFIARCLLAGIERLCLANARKSWSIFAYISSALLLGLPFILLLKEGWLERIALEESAVMVIILVFIVIYWAVVISRGLKNLRANR